MEIFKMKFMCLGVLGLALVGCGGADPTSQNDEGAPVDSAGVGGMPIVAMGGAGGSAGAVSVSKGGSGGSGGAADACWILGVDVCTPAKGGSGGAATGGMGGSPSVAGMGGASNLFPIPTQCNETKPCGIGTTTCTTGNPIVGIAFNGADYDISHAQQELYGYNPGTNSVITISTEHFTFDITHYPGLACNNGVVQFPWTGNGQSGWVTMEWGVWNP
jgi:hypothetical protein